MKFMMQPTLHLHQLCGFKKYILIKLYCGIINKTQIKNYGGHVLLVASQILLRSILLVNHSAYL
jgi:hypothetical protein